MVMSPKIHPTFWSDPNIEPLNAEQRLAMLWIMTNPQINVCGFFSVSRRRFSFETGLSESALESTLKALPRALKAFNDGTIYVRNFIRHQLGDGEQLAKNNIFKSILTVFKGIKNAELRDMIAADYPIIAERAGIHIIPNDREHAVSAGLRAAILMRDNYRCAYSGDELSEAEAEIDHVVPLCKGGKTVPSNLVCARSDLNTKKNGKSLEEFCEAEGLNYGDVLKEINGRASKGLQAQREGEREGTRTGEGKREGEGQLVLPAIPPETDLDSFVEEVYALYPRKVEPIDAKKAIRKVIKEYGSPLIRERTAAYAKVVDELIPVKSERQFVPHPATWFNAGGFLTDEVEWRTTLQRGSPKPDHRAERAAKQFTETIVPKEIKIIPKQAA
jgi:hypothetical protein